MGILADDEWFEHGHVTGHGDLGAGEYHTRGRFHGELSLYQLVGELRAGRVVVRAGRRWGVFLYERGRIAEPREWDGDFLDHDSNRGHGGSGDVHERDARPLHGKRDGSERLGSDGTGMLADDDAWFEHDHFPCHVDFAAGEYHTPGR